MNEHDAFLRRKTKILTGITAVFLLLLLFLFLLHDWVTFAQSLNAEITPVAMGGGEYDPGPLDHITDAQRQAIQQMLNENVEKLTANGSLPAPNSSTQVAFGWPLKLKDDLTDPGYHGISYLVDHNPAFPNQVRDYYCQDRTYDTSSGYNHRGSDFFLWPFAWNKMDADEVEIVAAAAGRIIGKQDGVYDRRCTFAGENQWNSVYVQHADGSVAWYGHMKKESLTPKAIGETVTMGEYLGVVGSSGPSTSPHLHFEVYRSWNYVASNLIDPYAGACNSLNGNESWWIAQRPFYDSAVNKLTTGSAAVQFTSCPNPTITNEQDMFSAGDTVYFTAYYRDQLNSQASINSIYRPDGSLFTSWLTHSDADDGHYQFSYWWQSYTLPLAAPEGIWVYEVLFEGVTVRHEFMVHAPVIESNYLPLIRKDLPPTPTSTPTATATPTLTPTATATLTPTVTLTGTATLTPTATLTGTATVIPTVTLTPTATITTTATISATMSSTATETP